MTEGKRRLAAIMFTDICGYTALSQQSESRALQLLSRQRALLRPIFRIHNGLEIKTLGDAFLVEFESALDATLCAMEIQRVLRVQGAEHPEEAVMVRVGVHLGDVVHAENDVLGDTVNIASRIEALAEPGGICVSQQVYDQVCNKLEGCGFQRIEGAKLRNVSLPISAYRLTLGGDERGPEPGAPLQTRRIAVLPLANFSPDPNDAYLADAMTDELINSLSRIESLRVIARTSVMHYKNTTKSISEIGGTLRVGSVLQGSVLKSGNRIRITVQLVEANTDEQLWVSKYDRELTDIFVIQDDIAQNITESLKVRLARADEKAPPENIDVYTHYLRGRTLLYERTEQAMKEAMRYFEEAIAKDPHYARAYSGLADAHYLLGYYAALPFEEACATAKQQARKSLELDGSLAEAHATLGTVLDHFDHDYEGAEDEFKRAISLNPSYAQARHWYAITLATLGRIGEAVEEITKAQDADPLSQQISVVKGIMLSWSGRDEEALKEWDMVLKKNPGFHNLYFQRAMHYISRGQKELAFADVGEKVALTPDDVNSKFLLGYANAHFGEKKKAEETIRELKTLSKQKIIPSALFAHLYAALGDDDEFFHWADRAVAEHRFEILEVRYARPYERIRADPRYVGLLEKSGLSD
jgi:adenylate cyclase